MRPRVILASAIVFCAMSCSPNLLEPARSDRSPKETEGRPLTKSTLGTEEEVELDEGMLRHIAQTDHRLILMHHVEWRDSAYVQTLTAEDMECLKITAEEQAFGAAYVVRLNELSIQQ